MSTADAAKEVGIQLERVNPLTPHRSALPALTGIRFFAACYVVLYHSHVPQVLLHWHLTLMANLLENGSQAVVLFFLLSGFLLSYTYRGRLTRQGGRRRFWEARVSRIWPLYMVSLLLSTSVLHTTPTWPGALAAIFMVQAWNPLNIQEAGIWNFVCWTLSTEALFYVIFPFVQLRLEPQKLHRLLLLLGLVFTVSVVLGTSLHGFGSPHDVRWNHIPLALIHIPEFLSGMVLGNVYGCMRSSFCPDGPLRTKWSLLTTLGILLSLVVLCLPERADAVRLTPVAFGTLLFGLAWEHSLLERLLSTRIIIIGGQISYGVYLLQWPVKYASRALSANLHVAAAGMQFGIYCILLVLVSWLGFRAIEEPARKLLNAGFLRLEKGPRTLS